MAGSDNRALLDRYAAAWESGNVEAAMACYAPGVVLHLPGRNSFAGTFIGREAVVAAIRSLVETLDEEPVIRVEDVLHGEHAAALVVTERAKRNGHELEWRRTVVYRFVEDAISEISIFHEDEYAVDAFFS
jgi:ketosteroid isomerase-like protein